MTVASSSHKTMVPWTLLVILLAPAFCGPILPCGNLDDNSCIKSTLQSFIRELGTNGAPELGIGRLEPAHLQNVEFEVKRRGLIGSKPPFGKAAELVATVRFLNTTAVGLSRLKLLSVRLGQCVIDELGLTDKSVTDWRSFCREVIFDACVHERSIIGGEEKLVKAGHSLRSLIRRKEKENYRKGSGKQQGRSELKKSRVMADIQLMVPRILLRGRLYVSGRFGVLPIAGGGPFNITTGEVHGVLRLRGKQIQQQDSVHLLLEECKLTPRVTYLHLEADNFLRSNPALSKMVVGFTNRFWPLMYEDSLPDLEQNLEKYGLEILNKIFLKVPFNDIFPNSTTQKPKPTNIKSSSKPTSRRSTTQRTTPRFTTTQRTESRRTTQRTTSRRTTQRTTSRRTTQRTTSRRTTQRTTSQRITAHTTPKKTLTTTKKIIKLELLFLG